jgi:hypothetical protein
VQQDIQWVLCSPGMKQEERRQHQAVWLLLQGRPAQSVQWGAWAEAGMAAGQAGLLARLARQGYGALAPAAGLAALRAALQGVQGAAAEAGSRGAVTMAAVFYWDRFLSGGHRSNMLHAVRQCKV